MKKTLVLSLSVLLLTLLFSACIEEQPSGDKGTVEIILQFADGGDSITNGKDPARETSAIDEVYCYIDQYSNPVDDFGLSLSGGYFQASVELDEGSGYSVYVDCFDSGIRSYTGFQDNISITAGQTNTVNIILQLEIPADPSNLAASTLDENSITLSWLDNSVNETGYYVERMAPGDSWTLLNTLGANAVSYQDDSCIPNTEYYYRVQAYNNAGNSGYSNEDHATTSSGSGVTSILNEGFEGFTVGNFPPAWTLPYDGMGPGYQYVSSEDAVSGNNCFKLESANGWPALAYFTLPETPSDVWVEGWIKMIAIGSPSFTYDIGRIGFYNYAAVSGGQTYADAVFWNDGLYFGGFYIGSYSTDTWYKVTIKYESGSKEGSLWINDILYASDTDFSSTAGNYDSICLEAGMDTNVKCLFDDVKVWYE